MMLVFCRRLALPIWTTGCLAVALTVSPPALPFIVAILGFAGIAFSVAGLLPHGQTLPSPVPVVSYRPRSRFRAVTVIAPQDAVDLSRLDDDGGWRL
jgi:hypothetical protein